MSQPNSYTIEEVENHNKEGDCWIVIDGKVYDVSKFADLHPGGKYVLLQNSGKDVTEQYKVYHNTSILKKYGPKFYKGELKGYKKRQLNLPGTFGDLIPYGDPIWYQRFNSPYYKETHIKWREYVRNFCETEIFPTIESWKGDSIPPKDIYMKMGQAGLLACMCGPPWPSAYLPEHIKGPENFDYFHELIVHDEISRCGYSSVIAALTNGPAIGLPVILRFGSEEMKKRVAPDVLLGKKYISLAISEPNAGSDVAGMITNAREEGDYFVLNGNKKWITNGMYADYHVTAVRTGNSGQLSFFVVDTNTPGFSVRKIDIRDSDISGTAYLDFYNCKVHKNNLIGKKDQGFKLVMFNFNHERFYISTIMARLSRVCIEECVKYALNRKAFGKNLSEIQSIRMKISAMAREVESYQAWLEYVTYQMCTMSHGEANTKIGDVISLLKAHGSKVYEYCAHESTMIFGGNALYKNGPGRKIEPAVFQVKAYQIPAGAQDVMDDYAARVAFKTAKAVAKL